MTPPKFVKYNPFNSVIFAYSGIKLAFSREINLTIQLAVTIIFSATPLIFSLPKYWIVINLFAGFQVLAFEMLNTAFETLCDIVDSKYNYQIKVVKDIAAGAVLIFSLLWALIIAYQIYIIIFGI